ncbi:MAG: hypothetical protein KAS71_00725 [Bacteroidales bacterium]|nr:hypothetical protein [Bacteroidales bacterium]
MSWLGYKITQSKNWKNSYLDTKQKTLAKAKIIYQSDEEVLGKHLRSSEWIYYTGHLTIYDRKTYSVVLKLKNETLDSFLHEITEEEKEIKGKSISEVFGKVAKWLYKRGVIFQN